MKPMGESGGINETHGGMGRKNITHRGVCKAKLKPMGEREAKPTPSFTGVVCRIPHYPIPVGSP